MSESFESVRRDQAARQIEQKEHQDMRGKKIKQLVYANLYEDSAGTGITLTDLGVYYRWVSSTVGESSGVDYAVASAATDNITIGVSGGGIYYLSLASSFRGSNNSNIHGAVFLGGVRQDGFEFHRKMGGADVGSASANGLLTLASTNVIDLRFSSDTDNTTVTVEHVNLTLVRISA